MTLFERFANWVIAKSHKRGPDVIIGDRKAPYLLRWHLIPRNRFFNIYLHHMLDDDYDEALHDHPWFNISVLLKGEYYEYSPADGNSMTGPFICARIEAGDVVFRSPKSAHRLELGAVPEAWSLFITGPRVRTWGFWCKSGWTPYTQVVDADNIERKCP